jgi:tRNA (guanine-N7-)-methyltransferase
MDKHRRQVRSYVVRGGRISNLQQRALDGLSSTYCIPFSEEPLEVDRLFDGLPVVVEIGFGNGDATIDIARQRSDHGFLGIEVFAAGIGNVLHELKTRYLYNVRIIRHDAVAVFEHMLPPVSLQGIHLFFPDPWPKKRHHKRRIVQAAFISLAVTRLKTDGYIYATTDWPDYAEWMLRILTDEPGLTNTEQGFCNRKSWRPVTRYERKAHEKGHEVYELYFKKTR